MDFVQEIKSTLEKANYALSIIGPGWLSVTDGAGNRRLDDAYDPVRVELALALQSKSLVIPILVGGATMPSEAKLPADLRAFARLNAVELTDRRWSEDVRRLIALLSGRVRWQRVSLAAVALTEIVIILLWIYQLDLQNTISDEEATATVSREKYIQKMRTGSDECMAGVWPEGAVKGKSYHKNGNRVTELCSGVSGALDYFGKFFNDEELWRAQPSSEIATKFGEAYRDTFGPNFEAYLVKGWATPLSGAAIGLAEKANAELASQAQEIVSLKQRAGDAEERLRMVQQITRVGLYWTVIVGLGIIFWFVKDAVRFW